MDKPKKKTVATAKILAKVKFSAPTDVEGRKAYPNLYDCLSPQWIDGVMTRQAGRLSIKPDGDGWRISLECPTEGLATSMVANSLTQCFLDMEKYLSGSSCHWVLSWARQKKHSPTIDDLIE